MKKVKRLRKPEAKEKAAVDQRASAAPEAACMCLVAMLDPFGQLRRLWCNSAHLISDVRLCRTNQLCEHVGREFCREVNTPERRSHQAYCGPGWPREDSMHEQGSPNLTKAAYASPA